MNYECTVHLWRYPGEAAWYFVTLPTDIAHEITEFIGQEPRRGFGAVKVKASVDGQWWETSIFPDKKSGSYLLPIKKAIRGSLNDGDELLLKLEVAVH